MAMSLESLMRFEPKKAHAVLAAAVLSEQSLGRGTLSSEKYEEEVADVLRETRERLHIATDDFSVGARDKVGDFLYGEVKRAILGDDSIKDIADKLGADGELPLGAYKVRFGKDTLQESKDQEKYIRRVISNARDVQHVHFEGNLRLPNTKGMTLIIAPQEANHCASHWLLIDAMRMKNDLLVIDIFRVFPNIVDLSNVDTPLDMLRAFVSHYGVDFSIERRKSAKMFEQITFLKSENDIVFDIPETNDVVELSITGSTAKFDKAQLPSHSPEEICLIVAAYSVNRTRYERDRRRIWGK